MLLPKTPLLHPQLSLWFATSESRLQRCQMFSATCRNPWSSLSWSTISKHRSLDSRQLESLAEVRQQLLLRADLAHLCSILASVSVFTMFEAACILWDALHAPSLSSSMGMLRSGAYMQEVSESHSFFTDLARQAQVWIQATSALSALCCCKHTTFCDLQSCSEHA